MTIRPLEPILHVDLDAFYAGVEVLKDPSLRGKPVVVGGTGSRGVVSSASYEARRAGVRSAMPSVRARRLCPDAVFLPPDFEAYRMHSNRFREVLLAHTPLVEPISLDEAFLDCSGATTLFGEPVRIAEKIRDEVVGRGRRHVLGGRRGTKFVAKLASDHRKPDALVHVPVEQTLAFLDPLPVGRLWGVGEKTADLLGRLAIRTIGDLARTPRTVLDRLLGDASATHLSELAHGVDDRAVIPYEAPKSVGPRRDVRARSRRYGRDPARASAPVRACGRTTARRWLSRPHGDAQGPAGELHDAVAGADAPGRDRRGRRSLSRRRRAVRRAAGAGRRVRLLGVQASGLQAAGAEQLAMLRGERWGDVERAIDRIEQRFGKGAATPATLLDRRQERVQPPEPKPERSPIVVPPSAGPSYNH